MQVGLSLFGFCLGTRSAYRFRLGIRRPCDLGVGSKLQCDQSRSQQAGAFISSCDELWQGSAKNLYENFTLPNVFLNESKHALKNRVAFDVLGQNMAALFQNNLFHCFTLDALGQQLGIADRHRLIRFGID